MLAVERQRIILDKLQRQGAVKVSDLSTELQVTEKTVREDLEKLERSGHLKRIHGGAVQPTEENSQLLTLQIPNTRCMQEKAEIAEAAIGLIRKGDIIALDGGSTTLEIAKRLANEELTVLTNDVMIIRELAVKEQIRLIVPGGYRRHNHLIGTHNLDWIRSMNVQKAFLSATGIHPEYGLTVFIDDLIEQKKAWVACAQTVYCVADHSKFDKAALVTFADLDEVDLFLTDSGIAPEVLETYKAGGVQIQAAGKEE
ncbi:DeoR/GlpR transcriptional regulator [Xylanibacillus composti]|uniref:DeoR family transcriptional regulator n=1 Tax=Xylanibacillus composti TaxID=1572762 RepID=A0A8J4H3W4_9BACL|nr:DeoR/GlpR family DNA-binding transcription regulator [Xylanibacillus composti]MDT9725869.1 DeoR/GlpR transcriptional regulator [Xylanibacillus composti]GIQ69175.1 DeoR family transcriptional regulator [Xylanibacillus composti]